jgi:PD-(D/E)XK nuclease superfamily
VSADVFQSGLLEGMKASPGLPEGFIFSQGSLQDYTDCPRRFLLRYLLRLAWPALQSEPVMENERLMQQGERFHRLAQQYWLGVPADRLEAMIHEDELRLWWEPFVRYAENMRGSQRIYPEASLSAPLGDHRLVAQFDLITAGAEGKFTIFDWKTSRRKPRRVWLSERLQTRVYPYLLARAGAGFNGGQPIQPKNVEMIYWFPAFPDQPERFTYSARQYAEDEAYLTGLAQEIARYAVALLETGRQGGGPFPLTERVERCAYCVFRSLCERGEQAGTSTGDEDTVQDLIQEISLDFEQIAEIEF